MMKQVDVKTLPENVFSLIDDRWMLITAARGDEVNTMTASWGGLGVLWNKNVATVYIRPTRYTYEFTEAADYFTLSFFGEEYRSQLLLCGTKSGRDIDKVKECGFTAVRSECGDAPYFAEADLVLVCRKIYCDDLKPANFLDDTVDAAQYPQKDYHRVYIGEIVEALRKG